MSGGDSADFEKAPEADDVRDASLQDYWRADPQKGWRLRDLEALKAPAPPSSR